MQNDLIFLILCQKHFYFPEKYVFQFYSDFSMRQYREQISNWNFMKTNEMVLDAPIQRFHRCNMTSDVCIERSS